MQFRPSHSGLLAVVSLLMLNTAHAATLKATYLFGGNLNAQQGGAPALTATDPLGTNAFTTDTVFGQTRNVYAFNGNTTPAQQAGLTFNDSSNLVTQNSYSVELVLDFTQNPSSWRRLVDVENRQSDNGFYVDSTSHLDVFPVVGGTTAFTNGAYHHVVLTDTGGTVKAYLDGGLELTTATALMDISNANNAGQLVHFFLDNVVAGGQGEYSSGRVALIRLYDGALSDSEVGVLGRDPFAGITATPEPSAFALAGLGLLAIPLYRRLRRS